MSSCAWDLFIILLKGAEELECGVRAERDLLFASSYSVLKPCRGCQGPMGSNWSSRANTPPAQGHHGPSGAAEKQQGLSCWPQRCRGTHGQWGAWLSGRAGEALQLVLGWLWVQRNAQGRRGMGGGWRSCAEGCSEGWWVMPGSRVG